MAVSLRAATLTHGNIARRGAFTLNIPGTAHVAEADGAGVLSGHQGDKPAALGLAVARAALVDAPYVPAFPVVLACRLNHTHELGLHTQYVGEILDVLVAEEALDEQGVPDIRRIDPLIYAGGARAYFSVGRFVAQAFVKRGGRMPGAARGSARNPSRSHQPALPFFGHAGGSPPPTGCPPPRPIGARACGA